MNRPKVNALNTELLGALGSTFSELANDDTVKGLLLRAEGKSFSAGLDLIEILGLDDPSKVRFVDLMEDAFLAAFRFPKPMAVAVHGHAIAGGLVISMCADYIAFAEGDYKVGLTELAVGVPFPRSAWEIVSLGLAPQALRQLVYDAGTYPPAELFALGVGDSVVGDPVADAKRWLALVTSRPAPVFRHVKALHRRDAWERIEHSRLAERRSMLAALGLVPNVLS